MSREGLPNSSTYTLSYTSTVTGPSFVAWSAEGAMVFAHQCIKSQDQVQSVTREPLGLGGKR